MSATGHGYRPLITSLAISNQNAYLPLRYNFSLEQIQQIKKYLPKNLFKLHGVDADSQSLKKQDEQFLQKAKLKLKSTKGLSTQTKKPIELLQKHQVKVIEWYNKTVQLRIPYSSKSSDTIIENQINMYLQYYLENFMFFKNTLDEELYPSSSTRKLTTEQLSTETDIVFVDWNIQPESTDDAVKLIRVDLPIVLCLSLNQTYELAKLKHFINSDIISSISILLKHKFNTRVLYLGTGQRQFVCLNSYCNEQNALKEEQKLRSIVGQQKLQQIQNQQVKQAAKRDHKFLILILAFLVLVYFWLKIFPIHPRNENQYIKTPETIVPEQDLNFQEQQLF